MKQLGNIWILAVKDLKRFIADRMALGFAILFPFLFVILFNFMLSGVGSEDKRLEINLATREPAGGISHDIIAALETRDESVLKPGAPKIIWLKDVQQARKDVEDRKLNGFVVFPENFTEAVLMGYGCDLEVVYNPSDPQATAALYGIAQSIASSIGTQQVVNNTVIGLLVEQELQKPGATGDLAQSIRNILSGQASAPPQTQMVSFTTDKIGEVEAENPSNYVIPGYLVMFVFLTAALSSGMMVRERQNRTLERMLTTSASRGAVIGGIFAGTAIKGLVQIAIFWTVGILAFKIDLGIAPAAVILISILMILMSSAFGVMLATLVKTEKSASSIGVLASLILAPLGGCWWPLFVTPRWMQFIARITPHAWANIGFNKLMVFGADFGAVVPEMLMLTAFAIAFGAVALLKFRTEAE
ncbi:MAG: ABC transporter permease [Dehalococcoidia bacterium]|nr:ABC transporter permease [Dehalococcoidia bacterium]